MPIVQGDLGWYYSETAGTPGFTQPGDQAGSRGGFVSTTPVAAGANGIFDDISGAENTAQTWFHKCLFIRNAHATLPLTSTRVWITGEDVTFGDYEIGADPAGMTAQGGTGQATTIATDEDVPAGVTFGEYTTKDGGLVPGAGSLPALSVAGIWVRFQGLNAGAANDFGFTLNFGGDTAA